MSIEGLLNQEITLASRSSYGADGRPSFATGATVACRFELKTKRILQPDGTVLIVDAFCIVPSDTTVSTDDKITYDSIEYKVIDVFEVPGDNGQTHHKELKLQKWPSQ